MVSQGFGAFRPCRLHGQFITQTPDFGQQSLRQMTVLMGQDGGSGTMEAATRPATMTLSLTLSVADATRLI